MSAARSVPAPSIAPGVDGSVRDALDALLSFSISVRTDLLEGFGHVELFALARAALQQLMAFDALAVLSVDDDGLGFTLRDCDPPAMLEALQDEVTRLEDDGTFAWALYQNRPVLVPSRDGGRQTFLHALATRAGVQGIFCKDGAESELLDVLDKVYAGQKAIAASYLQRELSL